MDIVERLRKGKSAGGYWREKEAADEIERLRVKEVDDLVYTTKQIQTSMS